MKSIRISIAQYPGNCQYRIKETAAERQFLNGRSFLFPVFSHRLLVRVIRLVLLPDLGKTLLFQAAADEALDGIIDHGKQRNADDHADQTPEAAEKDDSIVLVTNAEFYQLFKDEIPAWKE